jgi:hypothetical protein
MKLEKAFLGSCLFFLSMPAWAYLDPGSISLWLQGLIAAIAAASATFRFWGHKLTQFLRKKESDEHGKVETKMGDEK